MKHKLLFGTLLVLGVVVLVVASLLSNAEENDPAMVVMPQEGQAYFPVETLTDEQGAVVVTVTQINLNGPEETLDFHVAMDTHSVNLNMDLARNAFLTTDADLTISPIRWDAPAGGHHVSGTLSFSPVLGDRVVLDGATQLTLTIRNVEVPERVFTWELQPAG